jgi:hypothetical protein
MEYVTQNVLTVADGKSANNAESIAVTQTVSDGQKR